MNVTILGLGSVLMGDDAVGPCLLGLLEAAVVGELAPLGLAAYRRPQAERAVPDIGWGAAR